jgi:hypothetical protein
VYHLDPSAIVVPWQRLDAGWAAQGDGGDRGRGGTMHLSRRLECSVLLGRTRLQGELRPLEAARPLGISPAPGWSRLRAARSLCRSSREEVRAAVRAHPWPPRVSRSRIPVLTCPRASQINVLTCSALPSGGMGTTCTHHQHHPPYTRQWSPSTALLGDRLRTGLFGNANAITGDRPALRRGP